VSPKLFDLNNPDVLAIRSTFGGGWAIPLTPAGAQALVEFFGEKPTEIPILEQPLGYIVEPFQSGDLAEHLLSCNCAWRVE
jgi:hypothetical protein